MAYSSNFHSQDDTIANKRIVDDTEDIVDDESRKEILIVLGYALDEGWFGRLFNVQLWIVSVCSILWFNSREKCDAEKVENNKTDDEYMRTDRR